MDSLLAGKVRQGMGNPPAIIEFVIISPVYNMCSYIDHTINSIFIQKGHFRIRYHVQDAGSTDGTLEKLRLWRERFEQDAPHVRFSYASEPDNGMYDAIGKAFAHLAPPPGSMLAWINADDVFAPGAFERVANAVRLYSVKWVYGYPSLIDAKGALISTDTAGRYPAPLVAAGVADGYFWPFFQQEGCFFSQQLWHESGGCAANLLLAGDWDFWRRMARLAEPYRIDTVLGYFRVRGGQLSEALERYTAEIDLVVPPWLRKKRAAHLALCSSLSAPCIREDGSMYIFKASLKSRLRLFLQATGFTWAVTLAQHLRMRIRKWNA